MKTSNKKQYLVSVISILGLSLLCFFIRSYISYYIVALLFLLTVAILAILYDVIPVLIAALLSALALNLFFIHPILDYKIYGHEHIFLFFIYTLIVLVGVALINKVRKQEKKLRDKEEKEMLIKLYNTLLNSLSHELRTPIATIIGNVDTLLNRKMQIVDNTSIELLNEIEIASFKLNRQVENLLNMSRLESGSLKLKLDWFDINELVRIIIHRFADNNTHTILYENNDELPLLKIDEGLLEQIVFELIQNAFLYTPENTVISISVSVVDANLILSVKDTGDGIPAEEVDTVFQRFYRLPNSKVGGSGLGLSIVKGFVEALKGEIKLYSSRGNGAHFVVTIPIETTYINNLKNE